MTTNLQAGKIYLVDHSRKGRFVARVESVNGEWATVEVVNGRAKALVMGNEGNPGDALTIRTAHCQFTPVLPTVYTLIGVDGSRQDHEVFLVEEPGFDVLAKMIRPLIGKGRDFERVNVFHEGKYTDMFVDDSGLLEGLPVNAEATTIYHNNMKTHDPEAYAEEDQPSIHGPAVLFSRKVWF